MSDARQTATLAVLAAAMLVAALYGPTYGSPEPAAMFAILVGSFIASIAGMAFSAICGAFLLHLIPDPIHMLQVLAACSFASQVLVVWNLRRDIPWRELGSYVVGGVAGIGPGLWTLLHIDPRHVAHGIGAALLAYSAHLLLGRMPAFHLRSRWADAAIGFAATATGTLSTLPSLPVTVWCQARGLGKDKLRATVQPFVLAMQIVTLPLMAGAAPESAVGAADLFCIPASLFGAQVGLGCVRGLSNRQFTIAVASLLIFCGIRFWF